MIPDDMQIEFAPLRIMTGPDEEAVKTSKFARLQQALQFGGISPKEFKDACNKENLLCIQIDTEAEEVLPGDVEEDANNEDSKKGPKSANKGGET